WKKIAAFKEVADSLRLSAQLQLALLLGEESPTMLPAAKDVLSVWRAKGSPASYLGAVASTGFDKQLKVELSHLRPDYSDIKSPLLAGLASGIIPGAGQAYTGMYQTAAISFVLNGLFLLSTVELAKKKLGFSATITGIAFSTVYLGNIISAVQGAKALNRAHSNQEDEKLAAKITEMVESH
ncbi:MAG: hypothetical protein ACXWQO_15400, partial [Bdellovibrionota bacterium]